jgi:hypothetical protein
VRKRAILPLLLVFAVPSCGFAQQAAPSTPQDIIIELPRNIQPEKVWIRYMLSGPDGGGRISGGERTKVEANQYSIPAIYGGVPAQHARMVLYAPGCQFATYDLDLGGKSETTRAFQCDPLPSKKVHGFLNPEEFPTTIDPAEKKLDIEGDLDGAWVCEYFFQPWPEQTNAIFGSCLGSTVPLGGLGRLDLADKGMFEMTSPDFTRDPVFERFARKGKFGVIKLTLKEKKFERALTTIRAEDSPELGLNVQANYPDLVIFTRVHH